MKTHLILIIIFLASCNNNGATKTKGVYQPDSATLAHQTALQRETYIRDSISKSTNEKKVKELLKFVKIKKDEFKGAEWVEPKSMPIYRNRNGIYCYFSKANNTAHNFRFVVQYYADDWLFIKNCDFLIDGQPHKFYSSNWETDNGDGYIWEWVDEAITDNDLPLIKALANAKTAKVRFNGSQYYKDKTLSSEQLLNIKRMYELYLAMNGTF